MKLVLASNNKNKLREIKEIIEPLGYEVFSLKEMNIDADPEETGKTFEENAHIKAKFVYDILEGKYFVLADDSGLEVDYLNKAPGVYSHRYAGENATDEDRCNKLLSELENVPSEKRTARFVCALSFITSDGKEEIIRGECEGLIGFESRGENGFGYDPVFMYGEKSFAEVSAEVKNNISHRANALKKFAELIKEKNYVDK